MRGACFRCRRTPPGFTEKIGCIPVVVSELQRRLPPNTKIETCGAFSHLHAHGCDPDRDVRYHYHPQPLDETRSVDCATLSDCARLPRQV